MGFINSVGLIFLLWDILENPKLKFLNLMLSGMTACLLITFVNLFFFSTALLTPITRETLERKDIWGNIATSVKTISTDLYVYDMEILRNNEYVALAILGYGAITSFIFIFIAMMRGLGTNSFKEIRADEEDRGKN